MGLFIAMKRSRREKQISLVLWNLPCLQHPPWLSHSGGQLSFTLNGISKLNGGSTSTSLGLLWLETSWRTALPMFKQGAWGRIRAEPTSVRSLWVMVQPQSLAAEKPLAIFYVPPSWQTRTTESHESALGAPWDKPGYHSVLKQHSVSALVYLPWPAGKYKVFFKK